MGGREGERHCSKRKIKRRLLLIKRGMPTMKLQMKNFSRELGYVCMRVCVKFFPPPTAVFFKGCIYKRIPRLR